MNVSSRPFVDFLVIYGRKQIEQSSRAVWLTMTKWVVTSTVQCSPMFTNVHQCSPLVGTVDQKHLANKSSCSSRNIPNWLDSRYRTMLASHSSHAGLWLFCNMPICLQICPGTKGNIEPKIFKREDETEVSCLGLWRHLLRPWLGSKE